MLTPVEALQRLGGISPAAELVPWCGRRQLRAALERGEVRRLARGRYALPEAPDPLVTAARLGGRVSHTSAAGHWGMAVVTRPLRPHVVVGRHRRGLTGEPAEVHYADLGEHEVVGALTSPERTVLDCARILPFGEALAIADSALHRRRVTPAGLQAAAQSVRGAGRSRVLRVTDSADARSESPLESLLRALLIDGHVDGFEPQVQVREDGFSARVDLAHRGLRIVLEADSFEHHGHRQALVRDCRRYDELAVRGWLVLRFAWEQVLAEPEWVLATILAAVALRHTDGQKSA